MSEVLLCKKNNISAFVFVCNLLCSVFSTCFLENITSSSKIAYNLKTWHKFWKKGVFLYSSIISFNNFAQTHYFLTTDSYLYTLDVWNLHFAPLDMDISNSETIICKVTFELRQNQYIWHI